jgi:hypothetical protein
MAVDVKADDLDVSISSYAQRVLEEKRSADAQNAESYI